MFQIDRRAMSLLGLAAVLTPPRAFAEEVYPSRPIHAVVGFTPGASSDIVARLYANAAAPLLGQNVVVENKPGASSGIAAQYVARAAKDGYTLFVPALSTLINQIVGADAPYDMTKDFTPVALLAQGPFILVVSPEVKVHTVAELIALAKAKPGQLLSGSVGAGSLPHLCSALFAHRAGITLTNVTYPGSPQVTTDLIAGRITLAFGITSSVIGQVESGQLVALAVASDKRTSALPKVPTMAEAGIADFNTPLWFGLLAPAGTPRPIIDKLAAAAQKGMHTPETIENLRKQGFEARDLGPDQYAAFIKSEITRWTEVARSAGLKS